MRWTRAQFDALPDREKLDWLAYGQRRRSHLQDMIRSMRDLMDDGKPIDGGAYMAVWLAMLEG